MEALPSPRPARAVRVFSDERLQQPGTFQFAETLARQYRADALIGIGLESARHLTLISGVDTAILDHGDEFELARRHFPDLRWIEADLGGGGRLPVQDLSPRAIVVCAGPLDRLDRPGPLLTELARLRRHSLALIITARGWSMQSFGQLLREHGLPPTFIGLTIDSDQNAGRNTCVAVVDHAVGAISAPPPPAFRPLALVTTFNDIDIAPQTVAAFLDDGIDVLVQDNWSTDGTFEALRALAAQRPELMLQRYPLDGPSQFFDLRDICINKAKLAAQHPGRWIIHHDSDEIRCAPWPGVSLRHGLAIADEAGFNAIDFSIYDFRPIDDSFGPGDDPASHFRHFEFCRVDANAMQVKVWRQGDAPVDLASTAGHQAQFADRRVFPYKFLLKHYPLRSSEQARRKIFRERKGRFSPQERGMGWHHQYDGIADDARFLWTTDDLIDFASENPLQRYLLETVGGNARGAAARSAPVHHDIGRRDPRGLDAPPDRFQIGDGVRSVSQETSMQGSPVVSSSASRISGAASGRPTMVDGGRPPAVRAQYALANYLSPASFWTPEVSKFSTWIAHAPFAFWLVQSHRPSVIVEDGSEISLSFVALCQAVQALGWNSRCFFAQPQAAEPDAVDDARHDIDRYASFASLLPGTADDAVASFADRSIDLLHVRDHDGGDSETLIDRWRPKLSDRAIVMLSHRGDAPRAATRTDDRPPYPHFDFFHGSGLRFLLVGTQIDESLAYLCQAAADDPVAVDVRSAYARLGGGLSDRFGRLNQRELLAMKDAAIDARDAELARLKAGGGQGASRAAPANGSVMREVNADHLQAYAAKLEQELKRRDEQDAAYRSQIEGAQHTIDHFTGYAKQLEQRVHGLNAQLGGLPDEAARLRLERDVAIAQAQQLQAIVGSRSMRIATAMMQPLRWLRGKARAARRLLIGAP